MTLDCSKPERIKQEITFRRHCVIFLQEFMKDIKTSTTLQCTSGTTDDLVEAYNSGIKVLFEKHADLQREIITLRPNAPWYTEKLRESKHKRRKAERLWRRIQLNIHHQLYRYQCRHVGKLLTVSKKTYFSNKIVECGRRQKELFRITKILMGHKG